MSTKKLSIKYIQNKIKKEAIKNSETLESRLEMVNNKIKTNKNGTRRMKRNYKRTKNKKYELKLLELNKKLDILKDSKNEIQYRLDIENQKLSNIQQKIRDIRRYGEINPFDFNDINQDDDEINLNEFLDLAENNKQNIIEPPSLTSYLIANVINIRLY